MNPVELARKLSQAVPDTGDMLAGAGFMLMAIFFKYPELEEPWLKTLKESLAAARGEQK
jgi:hypothetical protein